MEMSDWWPAPAKINLFLHITARRDDGYHRLQTVFQFLDIGDRLAFRLRDDNQICRLDALPCVDTEQDLIFRAAQLLQARAGPGCGVDIRLDKLLPMGGGLGGGSSDAATTLVALNQLWGVGLSSAQLQQLGLHLGADVPVFILGRAAWAEGVGEHLTVIDVEAPWYVVIVPNCQVSTAEIFAAPELKRDCQTITIGGFLSGQGGNVCEEVVRHRYPLVDEALNWLSEYGAARMSGTGASVYVALEDQAQAESVYQRLPAGWRGFVTKGLNRSPLLDWVIQTPSGTVS